LLEAAGVKRPITPNLRHGLVIDQVLAEVRQGKYDLLVVGAHHKPGQNRWLEILLDDVADQLLNQANCSVLVV
jgi:nucleotide-binding universal stress UspA family protein